jgi:hypothetical protein
MTGYFDDIGKIIKITSLESERNGEIPDVGWQARIKSAFIY